MLQTQRSKRWIRAAVAGLGLTVATAVIATAARAPLSRSTPVNAVSARAPVTALLVLITGAGMVALASLAVTLAPRRRRKGHEKDELVPDRLQVRLRWKLVAILLPLMLGAALVAAAILGSHAAPRASPSALGGAVTRPVTAPPAARGGSGSFVLPSWLPWTVLTIVIAAIISGGVLLLLGRAQHVEEPSEKAAARTAIDAAVGKLDAIADPRAAVIAAYAAMEQTLAQHGVVRQRAEAPREYVQRVLTEASGAERDTKTLTGLFEEARFSVHPIPERARTDALGALDSLRRRLQAVLTG